MQLATDRPEPTTHRKAMIVKGSALEHTGRVSIEPIADFDLDRTIFKTLEGAPQRFVMASRVGKEVSFDRVVTEDMSVAYAKQLAETPLPEVSPALLQFLVEECDFDVEHADGSFLDHLYFCFEYTARHYPQHSPIVALLHSILGTGTNTFAMEASKIDALRTHLTDFEWTHIEAFPSVLRLLYDHGLREELNANMHRIDRLASISCHRVIDNAPITLTAEDFWIQMNYQLIHFIDFLPVANWAVHQNETSFIVFRAVYDLMSRAQKIEAEVGYRPATGNRTLVREKTLGVLGWLVTKMPVGLSERMAASSVRKFSERIGHNMSYQLTWSD